MPKMTYFKAQQWAFSFSAEHGYLKEDVDFLLLGQLNWTLAQLLSNYQREMPAAAWEKFQKTGSVFDYLEFRSQLGGEDTGHAFYHQGVDPQGAKSGGERPPHHNSHIG